MEEKEQVSILRLLTTKRFSPLFFVQFLGAFNDNFFKNALIIMITYSSIVNSSLRPEMMVTIASGLFILPFFLFSATAGVIADKLPKTKLVRIIKLAEVIIMSLACIGFITSSINMLMAVLFLMGTQSAFFGPVKYGILPELLDEKELMGGNSVISAATFISILLGTIAGGVLSTTENGKFIVSATIIIIASLGYLASKYVPEIPSSNDRLKLRYDFIKETTRIVRSASKKRTLFLSIMGISWAWFIGATFLSQLPSYVKGTIGGNEEIVTLFLSLFSIGVGLGSIVCNKLVKGFIDATYVPIAAVVMGVFTIDFYFASKMIPYHMEYIGISELTSYFNGWRVLLDCFIIAFACGIYIVPLYVILQAKSKPKTRSQTIAANNIINALFMVLSAIYCSVMLWLGLSVEFIFLALGIFSLAVSIYICGILPKELLISFARAILSLCFKVKVENLDILKSNNERYIIVANHTSFLDAILLVAFIPRDFMFAINTNVAQSWWVRPFLHLSETYSLDPTNPFSLKGLIEEVRKGKSAVIFPEGRITTTGSLMKIYEGPGLVADKSDTKILPIRIEGAQYSYFSHLKGKVRRVPFPKITLTILEPHCFKVPNVVIGRDRRQIASLMLYDVMTKMAFESSRYKRTLFNSLLDSAHIHSIKRNVLEDTNRRPLTYKKLITACFVLGGAIKKITEGDKYVGLMLPNVNASAVTFFAMQAFGITPAMINFTSGISSVISSCKTSVLKHVITSRDFIEKANLSELITHIEDEGIELVYLEDVKAELSISSKLLGLARSLAPRISYNLLNKERSFEDPAVVLFTSGSEGTPKAVVLSHKNIQANRCQAAAVIDFGPSDTVFNALPLFHSFGLTAGLMLPILNGAKTFLYPTPLHYRIIPEMVYDTNATIVFGTDTFLSGYAKFASPYDFYAARYIVAGAEKLKDSTRTLWMNKFGIRILEGYGATETSPIISINTPMRSQTGTVGRPLPGIEYKLENVPGIEVGGKLLVKGENIMVGYMFAHNPGVIEPLKDGWYDTGDIVSIDEDDYITIKGRAKRFAKIGGEMVSLSAVEEAVNKIYPDHISAIVAKNDDTKGERVVLVTACTKANREEIVAYFKENKIAEISIPKEIIIVDEIPMLGTGKIDYVTLNKLYGEN